MLIRTVTLTVQLPRLEKVLSVFFPVVSASIGCIDVCRCAVVVYSNKHYYVAVFRLLFTLLLLCFECVEVPNSTAAINRNVTSLYIASL